MAPQNKQAVNPGEVYCLHWIPLPAASNLMVYFFAAVEQVSTHVIELGVEPSNDSGTLITCIERLMEHATFLQFRQRSFVVVLDGYQGSRNQIETVLKPHGGSAVFDGDFVTTAFSPVIDHIEAAVKKQQHKDAKQSKGKSSWASSKPGGVPLKFVEFVTGSPGQDHPAMKSFARYVKQSGKQLPATSDPYELARYLYDKVDHEQTLGFQLFMMVYRHQEGNQLSKQLQRNDKIFLEAINAIVYLQNSHTQPKR